MPVWISLVERILKVHARYQAQKLHVTTLLWMMMMMMMMMMINV